MKTVVKTEVETELKTEVKQKILNTLNSMNKLRLTAKISIFLQTNLIVEFGLELQNAIWNRQSKF